MISLLFCTRGFRILPQIIEKFVVLEPLQCRCRGNKYKALPDYWKIQHSYVFVHLFTPKKERKNIVKSFLFSSLNYPFHLAQCFFRINTFGTTRSIPAQSYVGQQEPSTSGEKCPSAINAPSLPGLLTAFDCSNSFACNTINVWPTGWTDTEAIPPLVYLSDRFTVSSVTGPVKSSMGVGVRRVDGGGAPALLGERQHRRLLRPCLLWFRLDILTINLTLRLGFLFSPKPLNGGRGRSQEDGGVDVYTSFFSSSSSLMV